MHGLINVMRIKPTVGILEWSAHSVWTDATRITTHHNAHCLTSMDRPLDIVVAALVSTSLPIFKEVPWYGP